MMRKLRNIVLFSMVLAMIPMASWGCRVAGPNKHIGNVTTVNKKASTFTIVDAETRAPITFAASGALLKELGDNRDQVMVSFEEKDGQLIAVDIHF